MKQINKLKGYEDLMDIYYVTTCGKVYSKHLKGFSKLGDNGKGYMSIRLKLKNVRKWKNAYIHRLVALAYIKNTSKTFNQVNHKDEVKTNNYIGNLEWCDSTYNNNYGTKLLRQAITNGTKVEVYDYKNNFIKEFHSLSSATREILGNKKTTCLNKMSKSFAFIEKGNCTFKTCVKNSTHKPVIITHLKTGDTLIFKTKQHLHNYLKMVYNIVVNLTDVINKQHNIIKTFKVNHYYG